MSSPQIGSLWRRLCLLMMCGHARHNSPKSLMSFILAEQRKPETVVASFERYRSYLAANADRFPPSALALALSDWYFDPRDHRCPHDAWLENLAISEPAAGDRNEKRVTEIRTRLLGAYHDGVIDLHYLGVISYSLSSSSVGRGLGDWRYDEFRLHPNGHLIHEIEWAGFPGEAGSRWLIEATDVDFEWRPCHLAKGDGAVTNRFFP